MKSHQTGRFQIILALALGFAFVSGFAKAADSTTELTWRSLPLVTNGKVDTNWVFLGWGKFAVDDGMLRTDPDAKGLGLLVYKKEKLGNCQVRVVFKPTEVKSNSGVYVRIGDGILGEVNRPGAAFERDANGTPSKVSEEKMRASADREEGPWYAVHQGYEAQIAGDSTGSIYSLANSSVTGTKAGEWRTMIITLAGTKISVELDGKPASSFDSANRDLPPPKQWYEPKREPKRPEVGYLGLQTHDPGDIVWYKEIAVRPLPASETK